MGLDSSKNLFKLPKIISEDTKSPEDVLLRKISEVLNIPINAYSKILVILVLIGEKPASVITIPDDLYVAKILQSFKNLNLNTGILELEDDKKRNTKEVVLSKSKEIVEELKNLKPYKDHRRFGELMGFPSSAVDAFTRENGAERVAPEEQFKVINESHLPRPRDFPYFAFSKHNMENELQQIKKWIELIQKYAPELLVEHDAKAA